MQGQKEVTKIMKDGVRTLTRYDGVQREMYVFMPGNDGDDADGTIWTTKWDTVVNAAFWATKERKFIATGSYLYTSKDMAFRELRRWIVAKANEVR